MIRQMKKGLKSLPAIALKAFGIALMLCGSMQKIVAATATQAVKEVPEIYTGQFFGRPDVIFWAGVVVTVIGFLWKSDRDSTRTTIHSNHTELREWMKAIDEKATGTEKTLAKLEGTCAERARQGKC